MNGQLTDREIREALAPGINVVAPASFASSLEASIAGVPQRRPLWSWIAPRRARAVSPAGWATIVVLLLFGALLGILLAGSTRPAPSPARLLVLANAQGLRTIDLDSGATSSVLADTGISQVARSPDGELASFWTHHIGVDWLEVIRTDGQGRRRLAADLTLLNGGCIDRWSPDSTRLAVTAIDDATRRERILVVDLDGSAVFISPPGDQAYCPKWSPDGNWVAFVHGTGGFRMVGIARPDGSELHDVSGDLHGTWPSGAIAWSADGRYVYFDAEGGEHAGRGQILRADAIAGGSAPALDRVADAPELSPDGSWLAYDAQNADGIVNVWVARPDGSDATLLLENALVAGWAGDSGLILAESHSEADGPNGGLVVIRPDGSDRRVVVAFDQPCPPYLCLKDLGWGKPRQLAR
jgi:dipeptidyl aminopeptidase/acylaminoacyl peptidase